MVDWNSAFNTNPDATDKVADGDDDILATRQAVNERARAALDWNTIDAGYTGTGRPLPGSARAFFQASDPTTMLAPDGTSPATDRNGSSTLDDGRLLIRTDQNNRLYVRNQSTPAWEPVYALPSPPTVAYTENNATVGISTSSRTELMSTNITIPSEGVWRADIFSVANVYASADGTIFCIMELDKGDGSGFSDIAHGVWQIGQNIDTVNSVHGGQSVYMRRVLEVPSGDAGNIYTVKITAVAYLEYGASSATLNGRLHSSSAFPASTISFVSIALWPSG